MVSPTVKRPEKELLPSKACTYCEEHFEVSDLTWVGGQWFCTDCHLEWRAQQEKPPQYISEAAAEEAPSGTLATLHAVDNFFRIGSGFLRFGGYAAALCMATVYDFVFPFLHGVVLADVLTWIVLCWFDARFTKLPTILEFVGFVILTTIIVGNGDISVFENNTSTGIAFLGFLVTLGTKGLYQLHRHWSSSGSDAD